MLKADKKVLINELTDKFKDSKFFYVTEYGTMNVAELNDFRRKCFENNIEYKAIKNTILKKVLRDIDENTYSGLFDTLKGSSAIMFSEDGKAPAVLLKAYRKETEAELPSLKAAYIDTEIIIGDDNIEMLTKLKSKADLIGEVITLLQSPMYNLVAQLNSAPQTLVGLLNAGPTLVHNLLKGIEENKEGK